jgi:hypothetical protein
MFEDSDSGDNLTGGFGTDGESGTQPLTEEPPSVPVTNGSTRNKNRKVKKAVDPVVRESVRNGATGVFFTTKELSENRINTWWIPTLRDRYAQGNTERNLLVDSIREWYEDKNIVMRQSVAVSIEGYSLLKKVPYAALRETAELVETGLPDRVLRAFDELDGHAVAKDLDPTHTFNPLELESEKLYKFYINLPAIHEAGQWRRGVPGE